MNIDRSIFRVENELWFWYCHFDSLSRIILEVLHVLPFSVNDCTVCARKWNTFPQKAGQTHTISQLSSDWIMHCGSILLPLRLLFRQKEGKKRRRRRKERKKGFREMWCLSYLPWCLLCQYVDPVFLCTQTCYDGLGFVLSTQQMICDGGCLRALNMQLKHVWYHCFSISLYNCVITFCIDCLWIFIYLPEIWYIAEFIFHF